jgi:four helix bundle protein
MIADCGLRIPRLDADGDYGRDSMTPEEMKQRTKRFALRVIRVTQSLPRGRKADVLGRQLLKSGTSVGANYRAACRGRSHAEFIAKLGIVEEEADESLYWMELLIEADLVKPDRLTDLMTEGSEILAIVVASINTARGGSRRSR